MSRRKSPASVQKDASGTGVPVGAAAPSGIPPRRTRRRHGRTGGGSLLPGGCGRCGRGRGGHHQGMVLCRGGFPDGFRWGLLGRRFPDGFLSRFNRGLPGGVLGGGFPGGLLGGFGGGFPGGFLGGFSSGLPGGFLSLLGGGVPGCLRGGFRPGLRRVRRQGKEQGDGIPGAGGLVSGSGGLHGRGFRRVGRLRFHCHGWFCRQRGRDSGFPGGGQFPGTVEYLDPALQPSLFRRVFPVRLFPGAPAAGFRLHRRHPAGVNLLRHGRHVLRQIGQLVHEGLCLLVTERVHDLFFARGRRFSHPITHGQTLLSIDWTQRPGKSSPLPAKAAPVFPGPGRCGSSPCPAPPR